MSTEDKGKLKKELVEATRLKMTENLTKSNARAAIVSYFHNYMEIGIYMLAFQEVSADYRLLVLGFVPCWFKCLVLLINIFLKSLYMHHV